MALYPYDHSIYHPGHECRTCKLLKPARSKHCSVCKRCIAKLDHHCIFINQCVGYGNQHWFVLLLLSTAVLTSYGGLLGLSLLKAKIRTHYPLWTTWPPKTMLWKDYLLILTWGLQDNVAMGSVTLLALMTSPLVWGLLGYTLWLIYCGTTTNETLKWSDLKEDMDDGFAFKRTMALDRVKNPKIEAQWTRWPVETEQIIMATRDGQPPPQEINYPGEGEWERVWRLKDVENLYDLGLRDNLLDVFIPDYTFNIKKDEPAVERRGRKGKSARAGRK
jgi:palmitoyltransferase ZDHHC4